ncbi:hypothetical protein A2U01_0091371, partial [Trifolium medium]|nr:hypothetical protein [Trifolium medium]
MPESRKEEEVSEMVDAKRAEHGGAK